MANKTHDVTMKLHPEDESRIVFQRGTESRVFGILPHGDNVFVVTMPNGSEQTICRKIQLWGYLWHCTSTGGVLREFHPSENRTDEATGDVRAVYAVLSWFHLRAECRCGGGKVSSMEELSKRAENFENQMKRIEPQSTLAADFCAKYNGQRITN